MQTSKYTHIIWDWNGTLFDDAWLCIEVMNGMLARRRLPLLTPAYYEAIFDFPVIDYYQALGFDFAVEPFEQVSDEFIGEYNRRMRECDLRAGARETLARGRAHGLTQSILSAMKQEMLRGLIDHFDLADYFNDVVGLSDHYAFGKIELARNWLATQSLKPGQILFVGDTTHDYEVAQALGAACVYIHSGHHSRERLVALGQQPIETLADVHRLIDASGARLE